MPMPARADESKDPHPLSGNIWGRGCSLMSLGLILFFILFIAIRSWQLGKNPFIPVEQPQPVQTDSTAVHDSLR